MPLAALATTSRFVRQHVHHVESEGRTLGFVVIDSTIGGRARGGLRMVPDVTELELREAARSMTLKYGLLGLPQGGAKAGLTGDPDAPEEERRRTLLAFGRAVEPLLGARAYVPDADLGIAAPDVRWMMRALNLPVGRRDWRANRSGDYTAVSCVAAARATLERGGGRVRDCRVAIEGFGSVGSSVARRLAREGARIVAISTSRGALYATDGLDVAHLLTLAARHGSRVVEAYPGAEQLGRDELLRLPVDLLCPCARFQSLHSRNQAFVQARAIVPGANNPISTDAEEQLRARGVLCVPDFIANSGGVLGGTLEFAGVRGARIEKAIDGYIGPLVSGLLQRSEERRLSVRALAEPLALARHRLVRVGAEHPRPIDRIRSAAVQLYRDGWVPDWLMAPVAVPNVLRSVMPLTAETDLNWDQEWGSAWKAHPNNAWFAYQSSRVTGWMREQLDRSRLPARPRLLKTDAFEEACGFEPFAPLVRRSTGILMDVAPVILANARRSSGFASSCVNDVRALAFAPDSFDVVISPSTLDHFTSEPQILLALGELYAALRPGGRLLITLDNPRNPVLRLRRLVHAIAGPLGGIIPFPMGRTLSREQLVAALESVGFEAVTSSHLVHAPRVVALWVAEAVARRSWPVRLTPILERVDRVCGCRPLRAWSAHFVAAHARKPDA